MECENPNPAPLKICNQFSPKQSDYEFKDGMCFKDGEVYGKIVYSDNELLTVEVDNGNKYMKGQIIDFYIN